MAMTIQSPAFEEGRMIPINHTGEGSDHSPPLEWHGVPASTVEFALICDDPDAPTDEPWVHWLIYNIAADISSLPEHVSRESTLKKPISACQGCNSWPKGQNVGYRGPMPPRGHGVHHYHFKLYALSKRMELPPGIDKASLLTAMKGQILEMVELIGTYQRK